MTMLRGIPTCVLLALLLVVAVSLWAASPPVGENSAVALIELQPRGAATADDAAKTLFGACATKSFALFIEHLLLGVCDGPTDSLNKYAECLHKTQFVDGENALTVYDLPSRIKKETVHVVASQVFSKSDVESLSHQFLSTYYCEKLIMCFEVAAEDYEGHEYRTRIVVAKLSDGWERAGGWYAMPRCRSSQSFYKIADALPLKASEPKNVR